MYFFRGHAQVLQALDAYITDGYNRRLASANERIGGVRLSSARTPVPGLQEPVARYRRKTLAEYPPEAVTLLYSTPRAMRAARCGKPE
jgi:hypothetical protein